MTVDDYRNARDAWQRMADALPQAEPSELPGMIGPKPTLKAWLRNGAADLTTQPIEYPNDRMW